MDDIESNEYIAESRPSRISEIVQQLKSLQFIEKIVDIRGQDDGMAVLARTTDGNAYEITIRPAEYAQHPDIQHKTKARE